MYILDSRVAFLSIFDDLPLVNLPPSNRVQSKLGPILRCTLEETPGVSPLFTHGSERKVPKTSNMPKRC